MKKWEECLEKYKIYSEEQITLLKKVGKDIPYLSYSDIDKSLLTKNEKDSLEKIDTSSKSNVLLYVNDILKKFKPIRDRRIKIEEAENKICKIEKLIPENESIDFNNFYTWCSMYIRITKKELNWLYENGYIPHLYVVNRQPRFYKHMWFIVDDIIRRVKEKIGLGIFSGFKDGKIKPESWLLKQQVDLVNFMYYSWKIVEKILELSDKKTRAEGWKGHDFYIVRNNFVSDFYKNEGKVLAEKLLNLHRYNDKLGKQLLEFYRDKFALYSYEAFPLRHLITVGNSKKWRKWYLIEAEKIGLLSIYHPVRIDTYAQKRISDGYRLLSFEIDCASALSENREILDTEDIMKRFVIASIKEGKSLCNVCGTPFKPLKKDIVTCGKESCIRENKNKSKRKSLISKYRPF